MKKIYLLALLMGILAIGQAQTFTVTPSLVVNTDVDVNHAADVYIHFNNNMQMPIYLIWEQTADNYPSQWFMTVCDNASCFNLPHAVDSMAAVSVNDSGYLKVSCIPNGTVGTGVVSFRVYDMNSPTSSANVTFNFNATSTTAVSADQLASRFAVSPSPAADVLHLSARGGLLDKGTVALFDLSGQRVLSQDVSAVQNTDLSIAGLAPGIYMLRYESKAGTMNQKVVVAH
jgi:hypothetical protein